MTDGLPFDQPNRIFTIPAIILLALFLFLASVNKVFEIRNTARSTSENTIVVNGEAKMPVTYAIAELQVGVISSATTAKAAQDKATQSTSSVIKYLKEAGVAAEDINVQNYSVYPQYTYSPAGGPSSIGGYEVRQNVKLKVRDLTKLDTILGEVVSRGANEINSLNFTSEDSDKMKQEVLQKAIANTKEKAEGLAKNLGVTLGKVMNFSETTAYPYADYAGMGGGGKGGFGGNINPGQQELGVQVSITYEIR